MIYSITNVSEAIWSYVTSEIKDWATLLESVANFTQYSWAPNDKSLHDLRQPCNHDITKSQVSQMAVCLCSLFLVLTIHLGIYLSCLFFPRFSHWAKLSSMNGGSIIWSSPLHFRERKLCRPSRSKFGDLKSFASSKTNDLQAQHLLVLARWVFRSSEEQKNNIFDCVLMNRSCQEGPFQKEKKAAEVPGMASYTAQWNENTVRRCFFNNKKCVDMTNCCLRKVNPEGGVVPVMLPLWARVSASRSDLVA